jgi:FtsP/CotA-like multicopper oxidase with cupredoxin domain
MVECAARGDFSTRDCEGIESHIKVSTIDTVSSISESGRVAAPVLNRREFLKVAGSASITSGVSIGMGAAAVQTFANPDHTIRIANAAVELAPGRIVHTTAYNGLFPGPLLRLHAGRPVTVDILNETDIPEQFHWHGQSIPSAVDGAAEEGTPYIPARGSRRIRFTPACRLSILPHARSRRRQPATRPIHR